eukprot:159688_1
MSSLSTASITTNTACHKSTTAYACASWSITCHSTARFSCYRIAFISVHIASSATATTHSASRIASTTHKITTTTCWRSFPTSYRSASTSSAFVVWCMPASTAVATTFIWDWLVFR